MKEGEVKNKFMLEEEGVPGEPKKVVIKRREQPPVQQEEANYHDFEYAEFADVGDGSMAH